MRALRPFAYYSATASGELKVIAVGVNDTLPADTVKKDGIAFHPNGYMYVVIL